MAKKLYVGNLSYNTDDASLEAAFSADGRSVLSARVITDRDTGRSRGFGFVEFDDDGEAQSAMEAMDGGVSTTPARFLLRFFFRLRARSRDRVPGPAWRRYPSLFLSYLHLCSPR